MRRLHPPTLAQWVCAHRWKTTTSRPGAGDLVRVRYLTCRHCGLKVKTEERLAVPWEQRDFMALVAQTFPEDAAVDVATLRTEGVRCDNLSRLNVHLLPHGLAAGVGAGAGARSGGGATAKPTRSFRRHSYTKGQSERREIMGVFKNRDLLDRLLLG